jgi:predicted RNA-binding Zn ribbon-like protein
MTAAPQSRYSPDVPFAYVGGDVSLDLVNTTDWTERGLESDRLTDYDRLIQWARGGGILALSEERRLRQRAGAHPRQAAAAYAAALHTREVLQRVFSSVANNRMTSSTLDDLNELLAESATPIRMVRTTGQGVRITRTWAGFGEELESPLWPIVWSAAELLASHETDALRICAGVDCGWMYVDRSRNHLRRWCEMATCGTAAKNRRRAQR